MFVFILKDYGPMKKKNPPLKWRLPKPRSQSLLVFEKRSSEKFHNTIVYIQKLLTKHRLDTLDFLYMKI